MRLRASKRVLQALEKALSAARLERCEVDEVHKEAMRVYLHTWVAGPLKEAILDMKGMSKARRW